jgi:hypothetical protein
MKVKLNLVSKFVVAKYKDKKKYQCADGNGLTVSVFIPYFFRKGRA